MTLISHLFSFCQAGTVTVSAPMLNTSHVGTTMVSPLAASSIAPSTVSVSEATGTMDAQTLFEQIQAGGDGSFIDVSNLQSQVDGTNDDFSMLGLPQLDGCCDDCHFQQVDGPNDPVDGEPTGEAEVAEEGEAAEDEETASNQEAESHTASQQLPTTSIQGTDDNPPAELGPDQPLLAGDDETESSPAPPTQPLLPAVLHKTAQQDNEAEQPMDTTESSALEEEKEDVKEEVKDELEDLPDASGNTCNLNKYMI